MVQFWDEKMAQTLIKRHLTNTMVQTAVFGDFELPENPGEVVVVMKVSPELALVFSPVNGKSECWTQSEVTLKLYAPSRGVWDLNLWEEIPQHPLEYNDSDSEFELVLDVDDDDNVRPVLRSVVEGEGVHNTAQGFIDSMGQIHRPEVPAAEILPDEEQNEIEINGEGVPFNEDMKPKD